MANFSCVYNNPVEFGVVYGRQIKSNSKTQAFLLFGDKIAGSRAIVVFKGDDYFRGIVY